MTPQALDPASCFQQLQNLGRREGGFQAQYLPGRALADLWVRWVHSQLSSWQMPGFYQGGAQVSPRKGKKAANAAPTLG